MVALLYKLDIIKVEQRLMAIVYKEIDLNSIYQDFFNNRNFPITGLASHRVLGYTLQRVKIESN